MVVVDGSFLIFFFVLWERWRWRVVVSGLRSIRYKIRSSCMVVIFVLKGRVGRCF